MGERRARYLVSLERKLLGAGQVREEYRRGRLSWLQSLLILKVAQGERSEAGWGDYAQKVSVLRLRRGGGGGPGGPGGAARPPPAAGGGGKGGGREGPPPSGGLSAPVPRPACP